MKRRCIIALAVALLLAWPLAAGAQETGTSGEASVGYWDADVEGSADQAAKYEPIDGGPEAHVDVDWFGAASRIRFEGDFRASEDQDYVFDFDAKRMIRSDNSFTSLIHRLGRDPLSNLEAATNHGRVVHKTDLDPIGNYDIEYRVLNSDTELQFPGLDPLTLSLGYRNQQREGTRQLTVVSHCDTCHVTNQARPIDETTEDVSLEAEWAWSKGTLRASYLDRSFEESTTALGFVFDDALHPELRVPVFDNRLQYDSAEGALPVDVRPDIGKEVAKLQFDWTSLGGFSFNTAGVSSTTTNEGVGLESDYTAFLVNASKRFGQGWRIGWRGRTYEIDNDDVFVDVNERVGIAGPQAGKTYTEIYPDSPADFLRQSSLNRDVIESKLDVGKKFSRRAGTLAFLWDLEIVDREHYEVAVGEMETTTNVLGLRWSARPTKGLRTFVKARHAEVDNPFMLIDGSYSTLVSAKVPNPFHPDAAQYYESHRARTADTTADPSSWDEIDLRGTYLMGNTTLTASYRWWDGDNSDGDLTDWSKTNQNAVLTLWSAPRPDVQWYAGYAWHDSKLDYPSSIPIFDG